MNDDHGPIQWWGRRRRGSSLPNALATMEPLSSILVEEEGRRGVSKKGSREKKEEEETNPSLHSTLHSSLNDELNVGIILNSSSDEKRETDMDPARETRHGQFGYKFKLMLTRTG